VKAIHGLIGEDRPNPILGRKPERGYFDLREPLGFCILLHMAFFLSDLEMVDMRHKSANGTTLSEDEDSHGEPPGRPFKIENPLLR